LTVFDRDRERERFFPLDLDLDLDFDLDFDLERFRPLFDWDSDLILERPRLGSANGSTALECVVIDVDIDIEAVD